MTMLPRTAREVDYPTSDGKPMGETDLHRQDMVDVIDTLSDRYAAQTDVYVTGNLLLFYEEGNRRKHISPDVFMGAECPGAAAGLLPAVEGGEVARRGHRDHVQDHPPRGPE